MSDRPTQEPVPVKPAATVMLVRDRDDGVTDYFATSLPELLLFTR